MNSRASVATVSVVKFLTADFDIYRLTPRSNQDSLREALNVSQSPEFEEPMSLRVIPRVKGILELRILARMCFTISLLGLG